MTFLTYCQRNPLILFVGTFLKSGFSKVTYYDCKGAAKTMPQFDNSGKGLL
jgi:hypothetical protein